ILFTPWLLVILTHLSEVNAYMGVIIKSTPFQVQTLLGVPRFLRLDNVDFNGAYRWFVELATIPIVILLAYAIYELRQVKLQASKMFVWGLLVCSALPLIGLDFFLGGHRVDTPRYLIPAFLALYLALAALFSRKLVGPGRSARPAAWQTVFGLVIVARAASC